MSTPEPLPAAVLSRKAVVYVRQSTPGQVQAHGESTRRQYVSNSVQQFPGNSAQKFPVGQ